MALENQASSKGESSIRRQRDLRIKALLIVVVSVLVGGGVVSQLIPEDGELVPAGKTRLAESPFSGLREKSAVESVIEEVSLPTPEVDTNKPGANEVQTILDTANEQIQAEQFDSAIRTLNDARSQLQEYPEAYLLLGRALEGKGEFVAAIDFYDAALDRNPALSDAYWGYATAAESLGDLEAALGAMRNYLHTNSDLDPERLRIAQARSAIWEWESKLGRGAWGPTKGIPPGFTEEELQRDGRGVAIKIPLEETADAEGNMKYTIKHADKFQLYKPDAE